MQCVETVDEDKPASAADVSVLMAVVATVLNVFMLFNLV
jgi:hypothetical protein